MIKDQKLLEDYMSSFYGYGNLEGKYWFIGMEEGGGATAEEINSRLEQWDLSGQPTLLDNYEFHKSVTGKTGKTFEYLFKGKKSKYQPTWGGLIKILLNYSLKPVSLSCVKEFQSEQLGRWQSNNCIMEVFPLPSRNLKIFEFKEWTNGLFTSKEEYKAKIKDIRIKTLQNLITENSPEFVVFFSTDQEYQKYWAEISGVDFCNLISTHIESSGKKVLNAKITKRNNTVFAVIPHPVSRGITNSFYQKVAVEMRKKSQF